MATLTKTTPALTNGASKESVAPNQTLYISNLPTSKINKDDLKRSLYCLFSMHGPVLDVVAMRRKDQRGIAHVVYRDIQTSSQAMRSLQGAEFFGRELRIQYAKGRSSVISRLDGSVKPPESKQQTQPAAATMTAVQQSVFNNPNAQLPSKPAAPGTIPAVNGVEAAHGTKRPREEEDEEEGGEPMEEDSGGEAMEESDDE